MRKARDVSVHKSGNSYALYVPQDWAELMGLRRGRVFFMLCHRGVLVIGPKILRPENDGVRLVSVHKSGPSYAFYIPKDWARLLGIRKKRRVFSMVYHRNVLVVRQKMSKISKNGAGANGAAAPVEVPGISTIISTNGGGAPESVAAISK
jgi:antitoxin component of MazEF toxin-antitoxin module